MRGGRQGGASQARADAQCQGVLRRRRGRCQYCGFMNGKYAAEGVTVACAGMPSATTPVHRPAAAATFLAADLSAGALHPLRDLTHVQS